MRELADVGLARQKANQALALAYRDAGATFGAAVRYRYRNDTVCAGLLFIGAVLPLAPKDE